MQKTDLLKSYATIPAEGNPRQTESWALMQAAVRMKLAKDNDDVDSMLAAIRLNWRLWTIFQSELLSPENSIPQDIRLNVLSLANYVDKHTVKFIANPDPDMLDPLIAINRELSGGLATNPAAAPQSDGSVQQEQDTAPPELRKPFKTSV